jgi:hypothetical protein
MGPPLWVSKCASLATHLVDRVVDELMVGKDELWLLGRAVASMSIVSAGASASLTMRMNRAQVELVIDYVERKPSWLR